LFKESSPGGVPIFTVFVLLHSGAFICPKYSFNVKKNLDSAEFNIKNRVYFLSQILNRAGKLLK
jgi:hypothetical protein